MRRLSRFLVGTLRGRLILSVALVHAVMMSLFIVDLTGRQGDLLLQRQTEEADAVAQSLAVSGADWLAASDVAGLQELVSAQQTYPELQYAIITDDHGQVVAEWEQDASVQRLGQYVTDLPATAQLTHLARAPSLVDVAAPSLVQGRLVGWVRVGIGQQEAGMRLADVVRGGVAYALAAILIGSVIAWFMGRRVTARLYAVQETMDAVRSGDRGARSSLRGSDEAAVMSREFNGMLDALAEREAAVQASERRYRSLIDKVRTAIVVHDATGRAINSNPLADELLGLTHDQVLGRELADPDWRFLREDGTTLPLDQYPVSRVLATGRSIQDQTVGVRRGPGDVGWMLVSAEPEADDRGAVARIIVSFVEITARKHDEELLRRLNRELRAVSLCNEVLVRAEDEGTLLEDTCRIVCDEAGYVMAWVGYAEHDEARTVRVVASAGRVEGYFDDLSITWADTEMGQGVSGTSIRTGRTSIIAEVRADGRAAPWRDVALARGHRSGIGLPLQDQDGATFGALVIYAAEPAAFTADEVRLLEELAADLAFGIGVLRGRVELRKAEQASLEHLLALQESELRYREVFENTSDAIAVCEVTEDDRFRFLALNPAWARIVGIDREEAVGTFLDEYSDRYPELLGSYRAVVERKVSIDIEQTFDSPTGHWVVHTTLVPVTDATGRVYRLLDVGRDVTAARMAEESQRRLQEQFRQAQKMELVGQLAGGIAHDFNNLLTAIGGYGELLRGELPPGDAASRDDLGEMLAAAERAGLLTRQLLAFARRQVLVPVILRPAEVVERIAPMLRRVLGEQIELETHTDPDTGRVRVDPGQLEQVVMNLAVNARDAMPGGGRLVIETSPIDLTGEEGPAGPGLPAGPYTLLSVADSGSGMDEAVRAHLFEPFFTTKAEGRGTGLGLATVYGIVHQSGGGIAVETALGRGTTMRIYLPRITEEARVAADRDEEPPTPGGAETILLVEDDGAVRSLGARALRSLGYTVLEASTGAEALELLGDREGPVDLLLTDIVMPGMQGTELARRASAVQPSIRVLFASGYDNGALAQGAEASELTFLSKPFTLERLGRSVRAVLDAADAVAGVRTT